MYLQEVLAKHTSPSQAETAHILVRSSLDLIIKNWAGIHLRDIFKSGSSAKGTAISGKSDVDIFISLYNSDSLTLKHVFDSLEQVLRNAGYDVRRQNVSLGIQVYNYKVDVVPGIKESGNSHYHKLYKSKKDSWMQTNIENQIRDIQGSGRAKFIQLAKIWRDCNGLNSALPSMNIELAVLEALHGCPLDISLSEGFGRVLGYFRDNIEHGRLVDPYNSNNVISDDMSAPEKEFVARCAHNSLRKEFWREVIW